MRTALVIREKHLVACKSQEKPSFRLGLEDGRARPPSRASEGRRDPPPRLSSTSTERPLGQEGAQPESAQQTQGPVFCCPHSRPRKGLGPTSEPQAAHLPGPRFRTCESQAGAPRPPCTLSPPGRALAQPSGRRRLPGFWEALGAPPGCGGSREAAVGLAPQTRADARPGRRTRRGRRRRL